MAWDTSNRRAELPPDWRSKRRPRILARDGHQCQWPTELGPCGHPATDVDHKQPGNDHSDDNLWALCGWHHDHKTQGEAAAARRAKGYLSTKRSQEQHPGLVTDS